MKPEDNTPIPAAPEAGDGDQPIGYGVRFNDPNSPLAPYYLRASHVVAAILITVAFLFYSWVPLWHTDSWGHLAIGRWIVEHRELPAHEPLTSFGDQNVIMGHFQWLTQSGSHLLFGLGASWAGGDPLRQLQGGAELVRSAFGLLTGLYLLGMLLAYRRVASSLPLAIAGLIAFLLLNLWPSAVQRPQVVGMLCFSIVLMMLSRSPLSTRSLLLIPLVFVFWANAHGSFPIGLILLALFVLGRAIEVVARGHATVPQGPWSDSALRRLTLVSIGSVVGVLVLNPHGPSLVRHTAALANHPNIATLAEWQPLEFTAGPGGHWAYLATMLVLLASQGLSRRVFSPTALLLIGVFGLWPCLRERMMVWWLVLFPWVVMPLWAEMAGRWRRQSEPSCGNLLYSVMVVMIVGLGVLYSPLARWLTTGEPRQGLEESLASGTPWRVAAELSASGQRHGEFLPELRQALRQNYPEEKFSGRIFPSETQGDFLVWALPDLEVLVYTHAHLFTPEHWDRCMSLKFGEPGWREQLERFGVNLIVVEPRLHARFAEQLKRDAGWQIVLDESADASKPDPRSALLVALRKKPLRPTRPQGP
jgi:hypothetical protein